MIDTTLNPLHKNIWGKHYQLHWWYTNGTTHTTVYVTKIRSKLTDQWKQIQIPCTRTPKVLNHGHFTWQTCVLPTFWAKFVQVSSQWHSRMPDSFEGRHGHCRLTAVSHQIRSSQREEWNPKGSQSKQNIISSTHYSQPIIRYIHGKPNAMQSKWDSNPSPVTDMGLTSSLWGWQTA